MPLPKGNVHSKPPAVVQPKPVFWNFLLLCVTLVVSNSFRPTASWLHLGRKLPFSLWDAHVCHLSGSLAISSSVQTS